MQIPHFQNFIKMKTQKILLRVFLFVVIIGLTNCAKKKQNLLIGSWENVPLTEADTLHTEIWTFDAGDGFTYEMDSAKYNAKYQFISKSFNAFADIAGVDTQITGLAFDGLYKIEKINDDVLVLQCEEPYKHKEFTKKK